MQGRLYWSSNTPESWNM